MWIKGCKMKLYWIRWIIPPTYCKGASEDFLVGSFPDRKTSPQHPTTSVFWWCACSRGVLFLRCSIEVMGSDTALSPRLWSQLSSATDNTSERAQRAFRKLSLQFTLMLYDSPRSAVLYGECFGEECKPQMFCHTFVFPKSPLPFSVCLPFFFF